MTGKKAATSSLFNKINKEKNVAKIFLKNSFLDKSIFVKIDGNTIYLKPGEKKEYYTEKYSIKLYAQPDIKSKVSLDWLTVLLTEAINTDSRSRIVCEVCCEIPVADNEKITFSENKYRVNSSITLISAFVDSDLCAEQAVNYITLDLKTAIKKHTLQQMIFLSGLPLIIAGAVYQLFNFDVKVLVAVIILFFVAFIPSAKSVKKFNSICRNSDTYLKSAIDGRSSLDILENVAEKVATDSESSKKAKTAAKLFKKWIN